VIALPSLYEGQPMAALEAMAYKKPVIMYDFPFAREYITDWHNGLLAKGGDVEDLAVRIRVALLDKKLRLNLGQNAYERVRKDHNWGTLVHKYINLYSSLVQQG
jgi:1,4-alpha-glucan branching enzyme